jgi:cobalt-zinc-cadmium resistance protein CzcA
MVPLSLALIGASFVEQFRVDAGHASCDERDPDGRDGCVFGLFVTGIPFSVSAAIRFVALLGISVMDGIIELSHYNRLIEAGVDRTGAVLRTCELQMQPVLKTCLIAAVGLLPAATSTGIGSQVQKPLADVVVGGNPVIILITLPIFIAPFSRPESGSPQARRLSIHGPRRGCGNGETF